MGQEQAWSVLGEEGRGRGGRNSLVGESSLELGELWAHPETENSGKASGILLKTLIKKANEHSLNLAKC